MLAKAIKRDFGTYSRKKLSKMTLIIGMKYTGGILLVGDTKILDDNTGRSHHSKKIEAPIEGVRGAVGAAGFTDLSKEFNRKIVNTVNDRTTEYRLANIRALNGTGMDILDIEEGKHPDVVLPWIYRAENFLDDCANLTAQISSAVREPNPLEVLVAINTDKDALYEISSTGFKREGDLFAIGSGSTFIRKFLEDNYKRNISLGDAIHLGVFLIKMVESLDLDGGVGVAKGELPQIFIVNKEGAREHAIEKAKEKADLLKEVEGRIERIRKELTLE